MNAEHLRLCSSEEWGQRIDEQIMPWVLEGVQLGEHLLEVGPGPGLTTDRLRHKVPHLTALEIDADLAAKLGARMAGTNVTVVRADGTLIPFDTGRFSAAASFTMLHHVPSVELQDALLANVARVVQSGGCYVGVDSLDSPDFRALHVGDVCVPINPDTFSKRLQRAGFVDVSVAVASGRARFFGRVS